MALFSRLCLVVLAVGCGQDTAPADNAPPEDTNPGDEPKVLPIDTSFFIPEDTAPQGGRDLVPSDFITLRHEGSWVLSGSPFTNVDGTLRVAEYINEIDTSDTSDPNPFLCEVVYNLTGSAVSDHSCSTCDFVMEVVHTVTSGTPEACREPDVPLDGSQWELGYEAANSRILFNFYGTNVWLPWYDTISKPPKLSFEWDFTLAVEVEDTADMN